MTEEIKKRPLEVLNACEAIATFTAGKDFAAYESEHLLRSAVERPFEIIGEALNRGVTGEPSLARKIPDLHRIVGLRHRLIYGYDNVDDEILWDALQTKLGPLKTQVEAVLREAGGTPE